MKRIIIRVLYLGGLLLPLCIKANAQSALPYVLASAGGNATVAVSGGITVDFTLGEPIIATVGISPQLTQGFQQPVISAPLPVTLSDFSGTAKSGYNLLSWQTAQELNNDYFILERGTDGIRFSALGRIASKAKDGNSTSMLQYSYRDDRITEPVFFYRLKQVDKDGQTVYSRTVRLQRIAGEGSVAVFPNPARQQVTVSATGFSQAATIRVLDISGREVLSPLAATGASTVINLETLGAGTYFIRYITDDSQAYTLKITKE